MDIYFNSVIGTCTEFQMLGKSDGAKQEVSITISPLKVHQDEDKGTIKVTSGCNLWKACGNVACQFALSARPQP